MLIFASLLLILQQAGYENIRQTLKIIVLFVHQKPLSKNYIRRPLAMQSFQQADTHKKHMQKIKSLVCFFHKIFQWTPPCAQVNNKTITQNASMVGYCLSGHRWKVML